MNAWETGVSTWNLILNLNSVSGEGNQPLVMIWIGFWIMEPSMFSLHSSRRDLRGILVLRISMLQRTSAIKPMADFPSLCWSLERNERISKTAASAFRGVGGLYCVYETLEIQ